MNQAMTAISEIVESKEHTDITEEKVYYFVSVTMTNLPFKLNGDYIAISDYPNLKIGGYISINIEEFELFLKVLMVTNANPFGWYIEKYRQEPDSSFKNFLNRYGKSNQDPISKLAEEFNYKANEYFGTYIDGK